MFDEKSLLCCLLEGMYVCLLAKKNLVKSVLRAYFHIRGCMPMGVLIPNVRIYARLTRGENSQQACLKFHNLGQPFWENEKKLDRKRKLPLSLAHYQFISFIIINR